MLKIDIYRWHNYVVSYTKVTLKGKARVNIYELWVQWCIRGGLLSIPADKPLTGIFCIFMNFNHCSCEGITEPYLPYIMSKWWHISIEEVPVTTIPRMSPLWEKDSFLTTVFSRACRIIENSFRILASR